jgi:uncharacterized membrane protein
MCKADATLVTAIGTGNGRAQGALEGLMKRYLVLYLATLIVLVPIDFPTNATWQSALLYGALFGLFC